MICNKLETCIEKAFAGERMPNCANGNSLNCLISFNCRSRVQCEENKKKYILENTSGVQVLAYKMDDGVIVLDKSVPEGISKCDYLFLTHKKENAVLVELKGKQVSHAFRQLTEVLHLFNGVFKNCSHVYGRVVAASYTPKLLATPDYVNLKKLLRSFNGNLKVAEKQMIEKDTELRIEN